MFAASQVDGNPNIYALQYTGKIPGRSLSFNFFDSLRGKFNAYSKAREQTSGDIARQANYPNNNEGFSTIAILSELQKLVDVPTDGTGRFVYAAKNGITHFRANLRRNTHAFRVLRKNFSDDTVISPFFTASHEDLTAEDLQHLLSEQEINETNYRLRSAVVGVTGNSWDTLKLSPEEEKEYIRQKYIQNPDDLTAEQQLDLIRYVINKVKYLNSEQYKKHGQITMQDRRAIYVNKMAERAFDFEGLTTQQVEDIRKSYFRIARSMEADFLIDNLEHIQPPKAA